MNYLASILIILICLANSGCGNNVPPANASAPQPLKEVTEAHAENDIELAKLIVKREHIEWEVSRDPFRPLIDKPRTTGFSDAAGPQAAVTAFDDLKFIGFTKAGEEYMALLKSSSGRKIFRVNDSIKGYTVEKIDTSEVILSNGQETITLKRSQ